MHAIRTNQHGDIHQEQEKTGSFQRNQTSQSGTGMKEPSSFNRKINSWNTGEMIL
jgi:hypothetical protein